MYADDTQLYAHFERSCADSMREALLKLENCIKEINHWILNGCDISDNVTLTVGAHSIAQSTYSRSLGVRLDAELTIESQIADRV